ncbi:fused phosphoribosylaminoimidazole carboxy formyl formyltransferase; inosine-monophosphate cyclohydrolase [Candidatus Hydrogenisulfobacillus filiaventi]|uniref:Bifunctional purine biosynthesis protein PurH n=1 Tax=Candidatus Hydrogenisulfobacillus filiaventi TaxID=2707344 RepID=A0A6F8ZHL4_9FIRM|nr:fused phosphoribosylaminoimidazole carboxy formyl formyltransferase; inosine-monophosphate cyclohydrolase [Candidatus Hydrogenisulfobacillus filiaventi]
MQWALMSVTDKTGIVELARWVSAQGLGILASGGTVRHLREAGVEARPIEELTGFGDLLGGRVKTLHPLIYAGLLARPGEKDQAERERLGAPDIVLVAVNLYPFEAALAEHGGFGPALVEEIDIGGVSLLRAAAKNFERILVLSDPAQYPRAMERPLDAWAPEERRALAAAALQRTAYYDWVISQAMGGLPDPGSAPVWLVGGRREGELRYGENPHQRAGFYRWPVRRGLAAMVQHQGKALSYNNLADADTAWSLAGMLPADRPAAVAVKHQNPCGVAVADSPAEAFRRARDADPVSIFGGIVAFNRPVDEDTARLLADLFLEVVIAPGYSPEARAVLARKTNLRLLDAGRMPEPPSDPQVRSVAGGLLVQEPDRFLVARESFRHQGGPVIDPGDRIWADADLAWRVVQACKSNAIVLVRDGSTVGIGAGQTNRIDAARQAVERAGERARGAVLASDAFFPFGDVMQVAAAAGVRLAVEPGGSVRDRESVEVAESSGVSLYFTDERHFRH